MGVRPVKRRRAGSMTNSGIGHVGLTVGDVETSVEFYRDILGLDGKVVGRRVARIASGRGRIVLHERGLGRPGFHFGFGVGSLSKVDEWRAWISGRNIVIYDDVREEKYRSFKIKDPDGYLIEIFCDKRAIAR